MYLVRANKFIGNVGIGAAGVDRASLIEQTCSKSVFSTG